MKKLMLFGLAILVTAFIFSVAQQTATESKVSKTPETTSSEDRMSWDMHQYADLECQTCHVCEFPTKLDPCLIGCPRSGMATAFHSPDEGPEVILMNEEAERYGTVVFSHLLHAEMFEMGEGCMGCHHYNQTGPIQKCERCHSPSRLRSDISKPDLRASFHRQCMDCHRKWDNSTSCTSCHPLLQNETQSRIDDEMARVLGRQHPKVDEPLQLLYETSYDKGKMVTFYHDEHVNLFGLECSSCHQDDGCISCHNKNPLTAKPTLAKERTFEQQHSKCIACHQDHSCDKCHTASPLPRFEHTRSTGFELKFYHADLTCNKCHTTNDYTKKLSNDCTTCHKTWELGTFDHKKTGFSLDEMHSDFDCESCHTDKKYNTKPVCGDCHGDDITFPKQLPGKYLRR